MLDELSRDWIAAKDAERVAVETRRAIEDKLLSLIGIPETLDGTENANTGTYKIKVVGRMNRKIDADKLHELAVENGIEAHLANLFRWKPEVNMKAWSAASDAITKPLSGAITTTPGRASFTITEE
jgi:hypothetical protein